jgi:hypothetical protein
MYASLFLCVFFVLSLFLVVVVVVVVVGGGWGTFVVLYS